MPGEDGLSFLKWLREQGNPPPQLQSSTAVFAVSKAEIISTGNAFPAPATISKRKSVLPGITTSSKIKSGCSLGKALAPQPPTPPPPTRYFDSNARRNPYRAAAFIIYNQYRSHQLLPFCHGAKTPAPVSSQIASLYLRAQDLSFSIRRRVQQPPRHNCQSKSSSLSLGRKKRLQHFLLQRHRNSRPFVLHGDYASEASHERLIFTWLPCGEDSRAFTQDC